jgi:hypothetical protein
MRAGALRDQFGESPECGEAGEQALGVGVRGVGVQGGEDGSRCR